MLRAHRQSALGNRPGVQRLDMSYGEVWAREMQSFSPRMDSRFDFKIMLDLENKKGFRVLG